MNFYSDPNRNKPDIILVAETMLLAAAEMPNIGVAVEKGGNSPVITRT